MQNKPKLNTILLVIIIILLVIGLVYVFFNISKKEDKKDIVSNDLENNICSINSDCQYVSYTGGCNTPEYVAKKQKEAKEQGISIGEAKPLQNVTCACESNKCITISKDNTNQEPVCNTGYDKTNESKVVSEQSSALITGFEKKCDGNYYITFDYLGPSEGDPESGNGSYYTNTNLKLRTFKIDSNINVKLTDSTEVAFKTYISSLKKVSSSIFNQNNVYNGLSGQPVFKINIENGIVNSMNEVYLP
jgi:hypothetical protein